MAMLLCRMNSQKSCSLFAKIWIKYFPWENQVKSRVNSGQITGELGHRVAESHGSLLGPLRPAASHRRGIGGPAAGQLEVTQAWLQGQWIGLAPLGQAKHRWDAETLLGGGLHYGTKVRLRLNFPSSSPSWLGQLLTYHYNPLKTY